jgi:hypothetical protein
MSAMSSDPLLGFRDTTDDELDPAFDTIDEILASRAGERWSNRPTVVT